MRAAGKARTFYMCTREAPGPLWRIALLCRQLEEIQRIGEHLERVLKDVPGTRNIFAERVTGGYYLDFNIRREEIARYGLTVEEVETKPTAFVSWPLSDELYIFSLSTLSSIAGVPFEVSFSRFDELIVNDLLTVVGFITQEKVNPAVIMDFLTPNGKVKHSIAVFKIDGIRGKFIIEFHLVGDSLGHFLPLMLKEMIF
jgi:hypothetical protein